MQEWPPELEEALNDINLPNGNIDIPL